MVSSFVGARRRIAQCRICLERDASLGIIPVASQDDDRCYLAVATILDDARVEIKAAGPRLDRDGMFGEEFIGGCLVLAQCMFRAMYKEACPLALRRVAGCLCAQARSLKGYLWARLERVA